MKSNGKPYLIRPIQPMDLEGYLCLAKLAGTGFSSLRPDISYLRSSIENSCESFSKPEFGKYQKFILVMIDLSCGDLIGCAAVKTNTGKGQPFLNYALMDHSGIITTNCNEVNYLQPKLAFKTATEVGSLFLHPDYRYEGIGRFLAKSRFLLMRTRPELFGPTIIAELRGNLNEANQSSFYDEIHLSRLGESLDAADSNQVDHLKKHFSSISLSDLSAEAVNYLGHPHKLGKGAYNMLLKEGFKPSGFIDLFDAGPIVSAHLEDIQTYRCAKTLSLMPLQNFRYSEMGVVSNREFHKFQAIISPMQIMNDKVFISPNVRVHLSDAVREVVDVWHFDLEQSINHNTFKQLTL